MSSGSSRVVEFSFTASSISRSSVSCACAPTQPMNDVIPEIQYKWSCCFCGTMKVIINTHFPNINPLRIIRYCSMKKYCNI